MEFTKKEFTSFRNDVEEALKSLEEKYGVTIDVGHISYSEFDFTAQLKVTKNDGKTDGRKLLFEQYCRLYGFEPEDYERELNLSGKVFKLVGFNPRSPKNCCSIYCEADNGTYKCSAEAVKFGFSQM